MNKLLKLLKQLEKHPALAKNSPSTDISQVDRLGNYSSDLVELITWIRELLSELTLVTQEDGRTTLDPVNVKTLTQHGWMISLMLNPEGGGMIATLHTKKGLYPYAYL